MRKICVVTGTRAEYGLLSLLMKRIERDPVLSLQIVATGMHLSSEFGTTYREIESDGFSIDSKVEMLLSSDSSVGTAKSVGLGILGLSDAFHRLRPDLVVVLGDRFEILAAVQAALFLRIPIAHIHGGETTEGAYDEAIRHAVTKMSNLHFVAAEEYRKRVIQLGESPQAVYNVGALGLECLANVNMIDRQTLAKELEFSLEDPLFLVTYHPATLGNCEPISAMSEILAALEEFPEATLAFTYPNADSGGRKVISVIEGFVAKRPERARAFVSLGQQRYLSLMQLADVVIGNSSSGLTEAPALKKATVNIGDRQNGRLRATSVIDVPESRDAIVNGIHRGLSPGFQKNLPSTVSLYGSGRVSERIVEVLKSDLPTLAKQFFDVQHEF